MDSRMLDTVVHGDATQFQSLIENDRNYTLERSCISESSESILHIAASTGKTEIVKELLKKKPDLITRLNQDGLGSIHIACGNGYLEIARQLLSLNHGVSRLKSSDGRAPIHFAAINGRSAVIKELLDCYPSCRDDKTSSGQTALHLAVKYNQFDALNTVVRSCKLFNIKELLNAADEDGNTILHLATAKKQTETLKLLLVERTLMDVNIINNNGITAMDVFDVIEQMTAANNPAEINKIRELLQRAHALRAKELQTTERASLVPVSVTQEAELRPQGLRQWLLKHINPVRFVKLLTKEVKECELETRNALLVVAVLIATVTYQAITTPPNGVYVSEDYSAANIAKKPNQFILFMVPNSIGFFSSLAMIILLIQDYPLQSLLGLAVRCLAANYVCGLLLIGPDSISAAERGLIVIGVLILADILYFAFGLYRKWSKRT